MTSMNIRGSLPEIIRNDKGLYEGTLVHYWRVIFRQATNLRHPYHNFRHMFHVTWLCYCACRYYRDELTPRQMRNLLIAALFHDYDHSGTFGPDQCNIDRAIAGLREHCASEDRDQLSVIEALIQQATHFPYQVDADALDLCGKILRDADMGQAFSVAWIQQVVFGLAAEWGKPPEEVLAMQPGFLGNVRFHTAWGRDAFSEDMVRVKVEEARELAALLEEK